MCGHPSSVKTKTVLKNSENIYVCDFWENENIITIAVKKKHIHLAWIKTKNNCKKNIAFKVESEWKFVKENVEKQSIKIVKWCVFPKFSEVHSENKQENRNKNVYEDFKSEKNLSEER